MPIEPISGGGYSRHEIMPDLLGGDESGHYHLTHEELEHLQGVSEEIENAIDAALESIKHEGLPDLLGGNANGHYHLTAEELKHLQGVTQEIKDAVKAVVHERLPDLLGGDTRGHYHLTLTELEKLRDMPPEDPKGDKGDKGDAATIAIGTTTTGAAGSTAKVTNTGTPNAAVFNFVIPKGEKGDKGATGATGAKGAKGDKGDTGSAGAKGSDGKAATIAVGTTTTSAAGTSASVTNSGTTSNAILNFTIPRGFFPTGTDQIYIPFVDASDPDNPIVLPYTPFVNLPKGHPPEWKIASLPSGYYSKPCTYSYYGAIPHSSVNNSSVNNGLLALLSDKDSATANGIKYYFYYTDDLQTWTKLAEHTATPKNYLGTVYLGDGWIQANTTNNIIHLTLNAGTGIVYNGYGTNTFNNTNTYMKLKTSTSVMAACISPELGVLLVVGSNGSYRYVNRKLKGNSAFTASVQLGNLGIVTRNGLAWSPVQQVFCAVWTNGTATSSDGEFWTTHTGTNTAKNLTDLTYREDLEVFFARCLDDKLFYASGDGITWQAVTSTPTHSGN